MQTPQFRRFLSRPLLEAACNGALREVLAAIPESCDVRIRDNEIHVYARGNRIAMRLSRKGPILELHVKYVGGTALRECANLRPGGSLARYLVDHHFSQLWEASVVGVLRAAENARRGPEGAVEAAVVTANRDNPNFEIIDRQVQLPGIRRRVDVLGIAPGRDGDVLVALEIKNRLDNRIQVVGQQVSEYVRILTRRTGGVADDIASSYATALPQLKALGRSAPNAGRIRDGMPVIGAILLAHYNHRSRLLDRAKRTKTEFPVHWNATDQPGVPMSNPTTWPLL